MRLTFLLLLFCQLVSGQISPIVAVTTQIIPDASLPDETADGKQVFGIIFDDSKGGTSNTVGVTVPSGILFEWDREESIVKEVTSGDLQYNNSIGSQWPAFGIEYNALSGKKAVMVQNCVGGSRWNSSTSAQSWYTNGPLYDAAKARIQSCLDYLGLDKPKGIFITLGINDFNGNATDILVYATSAIDRLNADFATPPIYMSMTAQTNSMTTANAAQLKTQLKSLEVTYSNVYITVNEQTLFANGLTHDNVHFNFDGNSAFGKMTARYVASTEPVKEIRRILNSTFINDLTSTERAVYKTYIENGIAHGWWPMPSLQISNTTSPENKLTDLSGLIAPYNVSSTLSNDDYFQTNGSSSYMNTNFNANTLIKGSATVDSFICGVRILTNATSAGVLACGYGGSSGSGRLYDRQSASSTILYSATSTSEFTDATNTVFDSDMFHSVARTASNASARYENTTATATSSGTSAAFPDFPLFVGARNGGGAAADFLNGQFQVFFFMPADLTAYGHFIADTNQFLNDLP